VALLRRFYFGVGGAAIYSGWIWKQMVQQTSCNLDAKHFVRADRCHFYLFRSLAVLRRFSFGHFSLEKSWREFLHGWVVSLYCVRHLHRASVRNFLNRRSEHEDYVKFRQALFCNSEWIPKNSTGCSAVRPFAWRPFSVRSELLLRENLRVPKVRCHHVGFKKSRPIMPASWKPKVFSHGNSAS
jgi:hypothetical protein